MKNQKGFSLPELSVVLTLVSVLSAIAVPKIINGSVKAKMIEVKLQMAHMFRLADFHYNIWGEVPADAHEVGFEIPKSMHFDYSQIMDEIEEEEEEGNGKGKGKSAKVMDHKTTVCHKKMVEITIANPAVANAHLQHGDNLGECDFGLDNDRMLTFQVIPKNRISNGCDTSSVIRSFWHPEEGGDILDLEGACTTYFPGTGGS